MIYSMQDTDFRELHLFGNFKDNFLTFNIKEDQGYRMFSIRINNEVPYTLIPKKLGQINKVLGIELKREDIFPQSIYDNVHKDHLYIEVK